MALTRLAVEREVVSELGPLFVLAGKAGTATGSNPDLNGPIAFAMLALGFTPADPTAVSDADVGMVPTSLFSTFCQLVQYFALKKAINSLVMPNEMAQDRKQDWNEMVRRFQAMLDSLQAQYAGLLQVRVVPTVAGVMPTRFPTPACPARFAIGGGRIDY